MFAFRGEDENAARTGGPKISLLIDFHAIGQAFFGFVFYEFGDIGKKAAVADGAVLFDVVSHPDGMVRIGNGDVENGFVGRKSESVGKGKVFGEEGDFAIGFEAINAVVAEFFGGIVILFQKAVGRIGKIKVAVGFVNEVIRAVEAAELVIFGKHRDSAGLIQPTDLTIAMLAKHEASFLVDGEAIGAGF